MFRVLSQVTAVLVVSLCLGAFCQTGFGALIESNSQVEIRLGLRKSGYEKLTQAFAFEDDSERDDLYFEFFDAQKVPHSFELVSDFVASANNALGAFVLNDRLPPEKLRITNKAGKFKWQYSKKKSTTAVVSKTLQATLSQTDTVEIKAKDYPELARIFELGQGSFTELLQSSQDDLDLREQILALSNNIRGRTVLLQSISSVPDGLIVPVALSRKNRREADFIIDESKVHVQLGVSSKIDELGHEQMVYEIEAERDGQANGADSRLALHFLDRLATAGLGPEDLDASSIDTLGFALKKYQNMGFQK